MKTLSEMHLDDNDAVARFVREVRLLDDELDHVNIISVVGRNLSARPPWFVMPYAETTLKDEIEAGRSEDHGWVVEVFSQVLEGMGHAHDREVPILHRDLKPANVLFVDGVVKVCDFGMGKRHSVEGTELTETWVAIGTQNYMSPEAFADAKRAGPASDVYALGKVLEHMLSGDVPEALYADLDAVPREFRWFIDKCCRRNAEERYANAAEALAAFRLFTASPGDVDPPMEGAEKLVAAWSEADDNGRGELVRNLDEHLQRNDEEEELYLKVIPRLPDGLVEYYMDALGDAFMTMLSKYNEHISGGLGFAYCDVVANFYRRLWNRTDDLHLKRMLLARLIDMGASHNRWYVGEVVGGLLADIDDLGTAMMVAEVIDENPARAEWFWSPWAETKTLQVPIADAFARATSP